MRKIRQKEEINGLSCIQPQGRENGGEWWVRGEKGGRRWRNELGRKMKGGEEIIMGRKDVEGKLGREYQRKEIGIGKCGVWEGDEGMEMS